MSRSTIFGVILLAITLGTSDVSAQQYIVGGDFDYAPFSFIDKTGKPSGMHTEVIEAIAELKGLNLTYNFSSWSSALNKFQAGETDIIIGIIFSEQRAQTFDFTIPINTEFYSIFIRDDLELMDLSCLYNYRIAVLDKDISIERYLIPMGLYKDYLLTQSLPEALSAIELGLADYVIAPNLLGRYHIKEHHYQNIVIKGPSIIPSIYTMAVSNGNTELIEILNAGINELRRSGKLAEIQERWNVTEEPERNFVQLARNVGAILVVVVTLLVVIVMWIHALRNRIRRQTVSLNLKNLELQRSEEKFRVITENSSDVIWHIDKNFMLTYISPADERIRGYKKEEVIGQHLFSILKPEGIQVLLEGNKKRLENLSKGIKTPTAVYELQQRCKDGSWIWVEATAEAFYDKNGNITGYHGVSRDISKRKRAELKLIEREAQLRELNSTKDKLLTIIAHDLRSPFNAILGFSELLLDRENNFDAAETDQCLIHINSSAKNTLILLDNLLAWAKSQTGNGIFNPEKIDLHEIANEILAVCDSMARIKKITLHYKPMAGLEVYADANMIKTIMRNLISNAVKFTHSGGEVTISAVQQDNNVEITIADNGVGMSEEIRNKLFRVDKSVITSGTAHEKGSGLGLILCKEFVEKHGGTIWVDSEEGKGSSFTFSLPVNGVLIDAFMPRQSVALSEL